MTNPKEKFQIDFDYECQNFDAVTANKNLLARYKMNFSNIQEEIKNESQNDYVTTALKLQKANYLLKLFLVAKESYSEFAKVQDCNNEVKNLKKCSLSCSPGDFWELGKCGLNGCYKSEIL